MRTWESAYDDEAFRVLLVCTGNICRSPIAEQVLRARLGSDELRFSSAGTNADIDELMPSPALTVSIRLGGDPLRHRARRLTEAMIENADVVLGMAREHRSAVVRMVPKAHDKSFTLREFGRLVAGAHGTTAEAGTVAAPGDLRTAVTSLATKRGTVIATDARDDDVPDPLGRSLRFYRRVGDQIDEAVTPIVQFLRGAPI